MHTFTFGAFVGWFIRITEVELFAGFCLSVVVG